MRKRADVLRPSKLWHTERHLQFPRPIPHNYARSIGPNTAAKRAMNLKVILGILLLCLSPVALAHGMSEEDQARILNAGFLDYIELGARHMLTGYDHLLFLFGVLFFITHVKDVIKVITAFTLGHSITLIFATILGIQANYYLIDAVIALTVCYKAFENINGFRQYFDITTPNINTMVFIFGLIHGFGLSTRLQQLPLGNDGIVLKIIAFNIGVEVGQIIALCFMLLLLVGWRKTHSFTRFSKIANVSLLFLGGLLFLMQLHGYQHMQYSDEYPLNRDDHYHIHADWDEKSNPLQYYENKSIFSEDSSPNTTDSEQSEKTHTHDGENYHSH